MFPARGCVPNTLPRECTRNTLPGKYFSVHSLGHSEYQEIHTSSALNIDSVKINTSLLMMREWEIHPRGRSPREISRVEGNHEGGGDGFPNSSRVLVEYGHSPHHQSYP